ncbi:late blight resistance homolog R1A-10 [Olea europaea subsp. europaea]|uniref:Late blight resistance homolog R1A-10 n=1 Tax=Olea europaea subsp. europaea TaxID=158383 RepID=A0A8S0U129_OLEEU|nr:late blight resistance homolog R1A-10 [Olea europaea subsp. europaea]
MDLTLTDLVERTEQLKIKDPFIAVPKQPDCDIGSLQVAKSPCEVSSHEKRDPVTQIKIHLLGEPKNRQIISIVGTPGLGKTTLAKKLYDNSEVRSHFDVLSWCVVSQTYKKRELLIDILGSAGVLNGDASSEMEDEEFKDRLYKNLKCRRYLVVMDDLWDEEAWDDLKTLFPDDRNGSRVLFTSRLKNMLSETRPVIIEPPRLSSTESWNLLEQNVFKKERCPEELQDIGEQIAANCGGLPLSIVMIAGVLSNMEKKKSVWQQVAKCLSSYISQKADDYIPSLSFSYMHLPNYLKPCFLYLSAFEEDAEIPIRKLFSLWIVEGFIEKKEDKTLEDVAEEYLTELINRSLLQVSKRRSNNRVKTCTIHDLVLDMCTKIAAEDENFLFQHQFMIFKHRNRLRLFPSHHFSEALSILYNSEKVRILDSSYGGLVRLAIKVMPDLRYLEIQSLESSIGELRNLEYLSIEKGCTIPAYLLNMPKLRHVGVGSLYDPASFREKCDSSQINSLQTLNCIIINDSKDEKTLRCSPNLRRLKCRSLNKFFPDLNFLSQLESLTMMCGSRFVCDSSKVHFPRSIKKLSLSKISLPWEKMSLIGTLDNLEILKLKYNASKGKVWITNNDEFQKLKLLKLILLNLEEWYSSDDHFPLLERLVLGSCDNLKMIPSEFGKISTLQKIEVYHCHKKIASSVQEIQDEQRDTGNDEFEATIFGVWD